MLILSQFFKFFYSFNANNLYQRETWYSVTQIIAILGIILNFSLLLEYRKRLSRAIFYAILSYFILPTIATIVLIFYYGLSLQNLALVISTQIMFSVDVIDVSQRLKKSQKAFLQASYEAEHDAMTNLWNKTSGMQKIEHYISRMQSQDQAALLFVDIDNFKIINDTYGHAIGNYWICEIAHLLEDTCRKDDIVCRFGGDEYLVLLKGAGDHEVLRTKMEFFRQFLNLKASEQNQHVHCSIGICQIHGNSHSANDCIKLADAALYQAKEKGKDGFIIRAFE